MIVTSSFCLRNRQGSPICCLCATVASPFALRRHYYCALVALRCLCCASCCRRLFSAGFLDLAILILESIPCAQLEKNGSTICCNVIEKICVCGDKHADNEMHVEFQHSEAESGGLGSRRRNRAASRSSHETQPSGYGSVIV